MGSVRQVRGFDARASGVQSDEDRGDDRTARAAAVTFGVVVVLAAPLYGWLGRDQWFFQDEWAFLAERDAGSIDGLLEPHNEHWSTLPVIAFRLLWNAVGLRSYAAYQVFSIGLHLFAAVLLRVVMRRSGVSPWVATVAASLFVLFGHGHNNILWAFQIGFVGSLVFGLAHLLLADHEGPIDWRDAAGLLCGLGSLMCSGVGIVMAVVVGTATLLRRGPLAAAVNTAPLAGAYLVWWLSFGQTTGGITSSFTRTLEFLRDGLWNLVTSLGGGIAIGAALALLLVLGLVVGVEPGRRAHLRRIAMPAAMLGGLVLFFVVAGVGRGAVGDLFGTNFATRSRYAHLGAALALPAVALGADVMVRRWRPAGLVAMALLLLGVPGNLRGVEVAEEADAPPALILGLAHSEALDDAPGSLHPLSEVRGARRITVGWLRDGADSGRIPELGPTHRSEVAEAVARLAVHVERGDDDPTSCVPLERQQVIRLEAGGSVGFRGPVLYTARVGEAESKVLGVAAEEPSRLTARYGPLTLTLFPWPDQGSRVCGR